MNIVYLSYWGISEGLTESSVLPNLKILSNIDQVTKIFFLTIEREDYSHHLFDDNKKVEFNPIISKNLKPSIINKWNDFRIVKLKINQLHVDNKIDMVIGRTSLAGAIGYQVYKSTGIPFMVESFEPHADYMLEAKVWSRFGVKYFVQKRWEKKIIKHAHHIVVVSRHYKVIIDRKRGKEVDNFGCAVDLEKFKYNEDHRNNVRTKLNFSNTIVGIYVGKFGDIYFSKKAFDVFERAYEFFGLGFRLIILSPNNKDEIVAELLNRGIESSFFHVDKVPFNEVPKYLSAADFAFSMVRPAPVRLFCSPIKHGEYWANGLPILAPPGIGEDSDIILEQQGGAIFKEDLSDLNGAFCEIRNLLQRDRRETRVSRIAERYRNFSHLSVIYKKTISNETKE